MFELQSDLKHCVTEAQEASAADNSLVSDNRPPPLPEKTLKGSKKSLVAIVEFSAMETVPEGSNSAEKDADSLERTSLDDDDDEVFIDDAPKVVLPPSELAARRRKNPNLTVAIPETPSEWAGHYRGRTYDCTHDGSGLGKVIYLSLPCLCVCRLDTQLCLSSSCRDVQLL